MNFKTLLEKAKDKSITDREYIALIVSASLIASAGLLLDNIYIVIGSMIVAPFFDPIISATVFLVNKDFKNGIKALGNFVSLALIGATTAALFFFVVSSLPTEISNTFTGDITFDFNWVFFFVSIVLGGVGAFLWLHPNTSDVTSGLAVAISLMPPLANISRGFVYFHWPQFWLSLQIFILSSVGILIGAMLVMGYNKYIKRI